MEWCQIEEKMGKDGLFCLVSSQADLKVNELLLAAVLVENEFSPKTLPLSESIPGFKHGDSEDVIKCSKVKPSFIIGFGPAAPFGAFSKKFVKNFFNLGFHLKWHFEDLKCNEVPSRPS
ncbi:hypothetical protein LIER_34476 [Lithospermum erythrorhizon]|uniref:Uncharacterized protein n=1 Tax=Lithospermum erythrorhizon TaxID=34254 RepID=A0AAV3RZS7_LITER